MKKQKFHIFINIGLILLLILSILLAVGFGSVDISAKDIYEIVIYKVFGFGNLDHISQSVVDIVWLIRLPRLVLAVAIGINLAVTGLVMQAIVKNPLADPYILGVSSGASLGATLAIILGVGVSLGKNYIGISAFIGAFLTSILVIAMANIKGKANSTKLVLSGMAISAITSSFSNFIVYMGENREGIKNVTYWLMGSLAAADWDMIKFILPISIISLLFFMSQYRTLNLMLLGDNVSITLGQNLHKYRLIYLLIASLNIGLSVYAAGTIGFVGLIIPHIVRMILGTDHRKIVSTTGLVGAIFLIWMDVLSRTLRPGTEIPIGILISLIGAPIFIYLMINKTYEFGGGE